MKLRESLKQLYFFYQRLQFYASQADNEYIKLSRFLNTSLLLGVFARSLGFPVTVKTIIGFNILMLVLAVLIGKFLVHIGITRFNQTLQNKQNSELEEIVSWIRKHQ